MLTELNAYRIIVKIKKRSGRHENVEPLLLVTIRHGLGTLLPASPSGFTCRVAVGDCVAHPVATWQSSLRVGLNPDIELVVRKNSCLTKALDAIKCNAR